MQRRHDAADTEDGHEQPSEQHRDERIEHTERTVRRNERHERIDAARDDRRFGNRQRRVVGLERSERRQVLVIESVAGQAWRFRTLVEREASVRFARLATDLKAHGFAAPLVDLAQRAAEDEKRHAALCLDLAQELEAPVEEGGWEAPRLAPRDLEGRDALLYEIAAQCCVAETESMATLTTLMEAMTPSRYREAVVAIAKDEIDHARLGWAVLEAARTPLAFLEPHLAAMLETGGAPLFRSSPLEAESEELIAFGVLPHAEKRRVFEEALADVIVPGFTRLGIATNAIDAWLTRARRGAVPAEAHSIDPHARE